MTKNKTHAALRLMASFALAAAGSTAVAEDIDIYSASLPPSVGAPNVLIVLDSSANWSQSFSGSTKFAAEKTALATVVNALNTQFNLGIEMYTESGGGNSNTDGGYIRFAVQPMTNANGTPSDARNCLLKMVGAGTTCLSTNLFYTNLDINNDKSNGGKIGKTMNEAYNYFAGVNAYAGNNKVKADPLAFVNRTILGPQYDKPVLGTCGKNFIIVINNGPFQDNSSDTSTATTNLSNAGGSTAVINPPDNGTSKNTVSDEWTRWLRKSTATNAITYTLEVGPTTNAQGPYTTSIMQSMGTQGQGGYYSANTAQQLLDALTRIFNDIKATNSVFASSSLPLSADNSGAFANQIYMGVFRPDAQGKPRWVGNVKEYQFAVDVNGNLSVVDSLNANAAGQTGFAIPDAVSFWTSKDTTKAPDAAAAAATNATNGSTNGFWFFDSKGSGGNFDSPDGEWVEKGGAAQQLRLAYLGYGGRGGIGDTNASTLNSKPARQVYTCINGSGSCVNGNALSTFPFDSSNAALTIARLGAADATELGLMLKWVRGQDTKNENGFQVNGADTDVRASIHGDILHSRPTVINYGTPSTSNNVYVFYGGNDGVFRAIKGGQAATDGAEQWAFIAPEFFGQLKRQYTNSPQVLYPGTAASAITPTPVKRDYFFDGPVGSYVERDASGNVTKAYLYIGMRRGGRFIYALDVTTPANPKFLWKKSSSDPGFAELGQTWSQPMIAKIRANTNPVLVFGAGYDAVSEDAEPPAAADTMGRAVYVIDAFTGAPIWAAGNPANFGSPPSGMSFTSVAGMTFSVAGDVLVFDRSFDGFADRIYASDVGGNVWRMDIDSATPSSWAVWKIAGLADRSATASTRKFLFGVDVVPGASYDAVFVGSGDREHPLATNTAQNVTNRLYMIKDTNTGLTGADLGITDTCGATTGACTNLFDLTASGGTAVPASANGWSIQFAAGEKVVNGPLVVAGHVLFGTNKPDTTGASCTASLGIAQRYDITFNIASTNVVVASSVAAGGGFLPSVVAGAVEINGKKYLFTTDNPLNPGGPSIKPVPSNKRSRAYWRQIIE
jgi:type IV pilus assembly protein PilY1